MGSQNGKPVLRDVDTKQLQNSSGLSEAEVQQRFDNFIKGETIFFIINKFLNMLLWKQTYYLFHNVKKKIKGDPR